MIQQALIKVGMAELQVHRGEGILKTTGLGSCIGLVLYDLGCQAAGMVHIMLPSSEIARETPINEAKYADTAIPVLIERLVNLGASRTRLAAKMAGGSQMFAFTSKNDMMRIGDRNIEACKQILKKRSIDLKAEDTGGNYGRTIEFDCRTGVMSIRSVNQGSKEI